MKETDLTHVRPGAPVDITIDTYPGCKWSGHVDTVSAGSDSTFSALPAENASGNWVKVVQRIPVRIAIDKSGRSAAARRHERGDLHRYRQRTLAPPARVRDKELMPGHASRTPPTPMTANSPNGRC